MRPMHSSIGMVMITLALLAGAGAPERAVAAVSTSYQLNDSYSIYGSGENGGSTDYTQHNNGITWYNTALQSTSYQITNGGVYGSSSSSSSSSIEGGTTGGGGGQGSGSRGDRAGDTTVHSSVGSAVSSSSSSRSRKPLPHPAAGSSSSSSVQPSEPVPTGGAGQYTVRPGISTYRFFDAVDTTGCEPRSMRLGSLADIVLVVVLVTILSILIALCVRDVRRLKTMKGKKAEKRRRMLIGALLVLASTLLAVLLPLAAHAANNTTPLLRAYNGTLLDSSGNPVTTAVSIRFSYWNTADYDSSDTTGTGAINTGSSGYVGWQEVQSVTPSSKGSFSVNLGSVNPLIDLASLPASTLRSLYLQVEVKAAGAPDTSYELLDVNASSTTVDRSQITSVPFARNADLLDQHDTGTGSGNIPVLEFGGKLPISTMAGGTNLGTFTLDSDNTETSEIVLQFGATLGKKLTYDITNNLFKFNASVKVEGNLTVTGLINGVDISTIATLSDSLKATSGAGLNVNVHGGSYRLNGAVTNYGGGTIAMPDNSTSYVFFGSGGLTSNLTGFPGDESYIPVAQVQTSAGAILSITDRRITSSDDREHSVIDTFNPAYEKASYQGDGADNVGQLSITHDNITMNNFYQWTSTKATQQDYDLLLRVPVSNDFIRWKQNQTTNPLSFTYRTTNASSAVTKLDLQVYDTNGVPVTLSGATTNLADTSWATTQVEFSGTPTWTPGADMLIRIKFAAKDGFAAHLGALKLQHIDLLQN